MSLKAELDTWANALKAYDEQDFEKALQLFSTIADSSKILCNMGLIYATIGEHDAAVEQFTAATQLDQYLAVAYFQCGVSNFLLQRYDAALRDFDDALLYLRGNSDINYDQLGLKFKLYAAEALFNKGLSLIYLDETDRGITELRAAQKEKATEDHNVIDDAITDKGEGYTVFSIPVGVLYRPAEKKLKNSKTKDYMGKAKLVAAESETEAFTGFTGVARMRQGVSPTGSTDFGSGGLSRSLTVAALRPDDEGRPAPLQRANTTINVSTNVSPAARSSPASPVSRSPVSPSSMPNSAGASLARSATSAGRMGAGAGAVANGGTRGLSVRKPGPGDALVRTTELYDNLLDSYAEEPLPPIPVGQRNGGGGGGGAQRAGTVKRAGTMGGGGGAAQSRGRSQPAQSVYSNSGSVRRRGTTRKGPGAKRAASAYEEEEEGYETGEYDEGPLDLVKIRVKLHYQDDVRGMTLTPDMPWDEFLERVTSKFGRALDGLGMKFKDEDGGRVSLRDEMDYELAIETVRETAGGKAEGRLEIWCVDE